MSERSSDAIGQYEEYLNFLQFINTSDVPSASYVLDQIKNNEKNQKKVIGGGSMDKGSNEISDKRADIIKRLEILGRKLNTIGDQINESKTMWKYEREKTFFYNKHLLEYSLSIQILRENFSSFLLLFKSLQTKNAKNITETITHGENQINLHTVSTDGSFLCDSCGITISVTSYQFTIISQNMSNSEIYVIPSNIVHKLSKHSIYVGDALKLNQIIKLLGYQIHLNINEDELKNLNMSSKPI
jgi:hypothetical protein